MKRKLIPPFWMLSAGAVSGIVMCMLHYEFKDMLEILLGVLVFFYILGCLFKWMLDLFEKQNTPAEEEKEIVTEEGQAEAMAEVGGQAEAEG